MVKHIKDIMHLSIFMVVHGFYLDIGTRNYSMPQVLPCVCHLLTRNVPSEEIASVLLAGKHE